MKEDLFINLIKEILPMSSDYIGDDTAYIPEKDLILTQDTLIEDVHFRKTTISPMDLGIKSAAVNLSDIAATGGIPEYLLISLSLPENIDEDFIKGFYRGIKLICNRYHVIVAGGDLTRADKITVSITATGKMGGYKPARRSCAKSGQLVVTTGEFGSSMAGFWLLAAKEDLHSKYEKFIKAHINPIPQIEVGRAIIQTCKNPSAMMDTSDGLADALYKISKDSNVSMEIDYDSIPYDKDLISLAQKANADLFNWIFHGGEDYQLIATMAEDCYENLRRKNIPVKAIGKVIPTENNSTVYVNKKDKVIEINSATIDKENFGHFR